MATMNVSLPDEMKAWVEAEVRTGRYGNSSDVVRDLIRREQVKRDKIVHWQLLVDEARASGISERTAEDVIGDARRRFLADAAEREAGTTRRAG